MPFLIQSQSLVTPSATFVIPVETAFVKDSQQLGVVLTGVAEIGCVMEKPPSMVVGYIYSKMSQPLYELLDKCKETTNLEPVSGKFCRRFEHVFMKSGSIDFQRVCGYNLKDLTPRSPRKHRESHYISVLSR